MAMEGSQNPEKVYSCKTVFVFCLKIVTKNLLAETSTQYWQKMSVLAMIRIFKICFIISREGRSFPTTWSSVAIGAPELVN
jgi:hypothetical protein